MKKVFILLPTFFLYFIIFICLSTCSILDQRNLNGVKRILTSRSIVDFFENVDYQDDDWEENENCAFRVEDRLWASDSITFTRPNCSAILSSPKPSVIDAHRWTPVRRHTDESVLNMVKKCALLKSTFKLPTAPMTVEESNFPLAYIFVGQRNADQTLRLFRTLYWPQNAYCFTYDNKSSSVYKEFMLTLASCFPENVLVNPNPINVTWGQDSVLFNVMSCFEPLLNSSSIPWKYVQVVSYNDFPLKTNLEMVRIMKIFNGSNDCDMLEPMIGYYYAWHSYGPVKMKNKQKNIPPGGLVVFKGSYATTMTREFVRFVLDDPLSRQLYKWINATWCPEEHYWATLIYNVWLKAPGAFPGQCQFFYTHKNIKKPYLSRVQIWQHKDTDGHKCLGKLKNWSCVYGVNDLPWLLQRPEFIAHKLYAEFEPASLYCLEEWHWQKTCSRSTAYVDSHLNFYDNLPAVRYQNAVDKDNFVC